MLIDRHRIDVIVTKLFQPIHNTVGPFVVLVRWIVQQAVAEVLTKEQALGKTDLSQPVAQNLFGFGHLLFAIYRAHRNISSD